VLSLDFGQLVSAFDAARAANPTLLNWAPTDAQLAAARLGASDDTAYGGALAYRYAHDGALDNLGVAVAADQLGGTAFGSSLQPIANADGQVSGGIPPLQPFFASDLAMEAAGGGVFAAEIVKPSRLTNFVTIAEGAGSGLALRATEAGADASASISSTPLSPSTLPLAPLATTIAAAQPVVPLEAPVPENTPPASLALDAVEPLVDASQFDTGSTSLRSHTTTATQAFAATEPELAAADSAGHDGATLFPASALMRASMAYPSREAAVQSTAATHHASARARLQWDAVDAWSALQQASVLPSLQAGETAWFSGATAAGLATNEADALDSRPPAWEVKRLDQAARFSLAHLT